MAGCLTPLKFENRNAGDTLEVEATVGPDGETVDVNLVPQSVRLINEREYGGKYPVKQPVFQTQKISTSIVVKDGKPALLGTANIPPPIEHAVDEKDQTIWLEFIAVHLVRL